MLCNFHSLSAKLFMTVILNSASIMQGNSSPRVKLSTILYRWRFKSDQSSRFAINILMPCYSFIKDFYENSINLRCYFCLAMPFAWATSAADFSVEDAYIRTMPPGRTATAGYLYLTNNGDRDCSIIGGSAAIAGTLEIHPATQ